MLFTKKGKEAYVEPLIENGGYRFQVKVGMPIDATKTCSGTKLARANFQCLMSGSPISGEYIRTEAQAGRMGAKMLAIVAEGKQGRLYLPPTPAIQEVADSVEVMWKPDVEFFQQALGFRIGNYGMTKWSDLFTPRQLQLLTTLSDLMQEARDVQSGTPAMQASPKTARGLNPTVSAQWPTAMLLPHTLEKPFQNWQPITAQWEFGGQPTEKLAAFLEGRPSQWSGITRNVTRLLAQGATGMEQLRIAPRY
jgi:hypothetical protein